MRRLDQMKPYEIELAAERWSDHLYDLYYGSQADDAWDMNLPEWEEILDLIQNWLTDEIPEYVRGYLEYDGDLQVDAYESGILERFGANLRTLPKDPDDVWTVVDKFFDTRWGDDSLMLAIWEWLPAEHRQKLVEGLIEDADSNGIREEYDRREGRH